MKNIKRENLSDFLKVFINENDLKIENVAKEIGCSIPSLNRILRKESLPTDEMLKQSGVLISIGYEKYNKLSKADKEKISERIGLVGGGVLGFGVISSAISASGAVIGLSAAGITSGLGAIGAIVGGGMTAGIAVVAAIPIAVAGVGFGIIKGVKSIISNSKLKDDKFDPNWEIKK